METDEHQFNSSYLRAKRAREFLDAHRFEPVPLAVIARAAHTSPYHLLRLFSQYFGVTPSGYLRGLRVEEAKRLLCYTELPVQEVARRVGFHTHCSFTSLFRRLVGMSPEAYRASQPSLSSRYADLLRRMVPVLQRVGDEGEKLAKEFAQLTALTEVPGDKV